MSNAETKANLAQKNARNALQRIQALEGAVQGVLTATNNALGEAEGRLAQLAEVLDAVVESQGAEAINVILTEKRRSRAQQKQERDAMEIKEKVLNGKLKAVATVGETSVLVFKELDKDGQALEFSRVQTSALLLVPKVRGETLGKTIGHKVTNTGSEHTFEIMEIYDPVPQTPEAAAAEAPAATEAAQ